MIDIKTSTRPRRTVLEMQRVHHSPWWVVAHQLNSPLWDGVPDELPVIGLGQAQHLGSFKSDNVCGDITLLTLGPSRQAGQHLLTVDDVYHRRIVIQLCRPFLTQFDKSTKSVPVNFLTGDPLLPTGTGLRILCRLPLAPDDTALDIVWGSPVNGPSSDVFYPHEVPQLLEGLSAWRIAQQLFSTVTVANTLFRYPKSNLKRENK